MNIYAYILIAILLIGCASEPDYSDDYDHGQAQRFVYLCSPHLSERQLTYLYTYIRNVYGHLEIGDDFHIAYDSFDEVDRAECLREGKRITALVRSYE